jgi:hypothetical protein
VNLTNFGRKNVLKMMGTIFFNQKNSPHLPAFRRLPRRDAATQSEAGFQYPVALLRDAVHKVAAFPARNMTDFSSEGVAWCRAALAALVPYFFAPSKGNHLLKQLDLVSSLGL